MVRTSTSTSFSHGMLASATATPESQHSSVSRLNLIVPGPSPTPQALWPLALVLARFAAIHRLRFGVKSVNAVEFSNAIYFSLAPGLARRRKAKRSESLFWRDFFPMQRLQLASSTAFLLK